MTADRLRGVYDEHATNLWHYVIRLCGDAARAEEVVAETLVRAWRNDVGADGRPVGPWLYTVARNLVIDGARSAPSRREVVTDQLPDPGRDDGVDQLFDAMVMADALRALTPEHRQVVVRVYYQRATIADLADELGIPPGTVKSRLHYGLRALRLALQERGMTR